MATYQKKFQKPYSTGYKDRPDESTPVTAAIKNSETETLLSIESFLYGHDLEQNDTFVAGLRQGMEGVTNFINNTLPSTYYNKNQTDAKIAEEIGKIPAPKDYDQQIADINDALDGKSNSADVYTKSEVYNKTETYTKKEVEDYVAEHGGGGGEVPDDIVLWEEPTEVEIPAIPQPLHRFSTEEKVVGYWVDGKPIYEKTYYNSNSTFMNGYTWYDTEIPTEEKETIVDCKFTNLSGTPYPVSIAKGVKQGYLSGMHYRNVSMQMNGYYTIQYTKTTD